MEGIVVILQRFIISGACGNGTYQKCVHVSAMWAQKNKCWVSVRPDSWEILGASTWGPPMRNLNCEKIMPSICIDTLIEFHSNNVKHVIKMSWKVGSLLQRSICQYALAMVNIRRENIFWVVYIFIRRLYNEKNLWYGHQRLRIPFGG